MHSDATPKAAADESKFWTTRNYILAALGGTLAVTAIIIVVSVLLSPAHISFSIVHASRSGSQLQYLNVTIAADNASQKRAAVRYQGIFVDLKNSTNPAGPSTKHALVYAAPPTDEYLPPGTGRAIINASVKVLAIGTSGSFVGGRLNRTGFTVVVTAVVRFRVGKIPTRVYDIKASCTHVSFPAEGSSNVNMLPINCTA
ncbi:hypothetical protein D1007_27975 [Hordeum vulgare]|uniref:Uncharacterized protein n=1 Tax=Hordeum vulgare subsp. vulgare TaxID=112509 RepID=A0A8I6Y0Y4_HORVV|nr:uncharacterized protein LOC123412247 [Hordeum vulgare subsp. vulgare]KAE8797017.1 hypothetical protein D1007_27975 [Hordeum vulgare]KAI4973012.1 hypothetical protein ZWY2020_010443 [Hordeum vulgare]